MSATDNKTEITLKGSVDIVSEFFFTAINSILYQRGKWTAMMRRSLPLFQNRWLLIDISIAFVLLSLASQEFTSPKHSSASPNTD